MHELAIPLGIYNTGNQKHQEGPQSFKYWEKQHNSYQTPDDPISRDWEEILQITTCFYWGLYSSKAAVARPNIDSLAEKTITAKITENEVQRGYKRTQEQQISWNRQD